MIKTLRLLALLIYASTCYSQKEDRIWYFGGDQLNSNLSGIGLDFNSGNPVVLTNSQMGYTEGSAVQSSPNGNLLFYTNGVKIWDKTHVVMPNGNALGGGISSQQPALIIPFPNDTSKFYLFVNDGYPTSGGTGLFYSIVDMQLNNGKGDVTNVKKVSMLSETCEWLTGTYHSNGTDYWAITADFDSCIFYSYKVSSAGIASPVKTNLGFNKYAIYSTIEFNNKGNKLTFCVTNTNMPKRMIADFNTSTGVVSNPIYIDSVFNQAACFSPDDNLFYYYSLGLNNEFLYQCNLNASNISGSKQLIATIPSGFHMGMKKGPDGKIYCNNINSQSIGQINNPNLIGVSCNYIDSTIYFNGKLTGLLFPNKTFVKRLNPLNILDNEIKNNIIVSPNPFINDVLIESNKSLTKYSLYNLFGEKIFNGEIEEFDDKISLNLKTSPGLYFLILYDDEGNCYKKTLVKQ